MQFARGDNWWLAARITGPVHRFLGLRFVGTAGTERLGVTPDAAQATEIKAGVARANPMGLRLAVDLAPTEEPATR